MEQTFQLWFTTTHQRLTREGETAKATLLRRSYQTVMQFKIYYYSQGIEYSDALLIHRCGKILDHLCWEYRI